METDLLLQDERVKHIRHLNENLSRAESYMLDCKEALKVAREAYESEVGKLRAAIVELSNPVLPFASHAASKEDQTEVTLSYQGKSVETDVATLKQLGRKGKRS